VSLSHLLLDNFLELFNTPAPINLNPADFIRIFGNIKKSNGHHAPKKSIGFLGHRKSVDFLCKGHGLNALGFWDAEN